MRKFVYVLVAVFFLFSLIGGYFLGGYWVADYCRKNLSTKLNEFFSQQILYTAAKIKPQHGSIFIKFNSISSVQQAAKEHPAFMAENVKININVWKSIWKRRVVLSYVNIKTMDINVGEHKVDLYDLDNSRFVADLYNLNINIEKGSLYLGSNNKVKFSLASHKNNNNNLISFELDSPNIGPWLNLSSLPRISGKFSNVNIQTSWNRRGIGLVDITYINPDLHGDIKLHGGHGKLVFNCEAKSFSYQHKRGNLLLDSFYTKTINLHDIVIQGKWNKTHDLNYQIDWQNGVINATNFKPLFIKLHGKLLWAQKTKRLIWDIAMDFVSFNSQQVMQWLPEKNIEKSLLQWLKTSVLNGELSFLRLKGINNNFDIYATVKDVTLCYSVDWPKIENLCANLVYEQNKFFIIANQAKIAGIATQNLRADFFANQNHALGDLRVQTSFLTGFKQGFDFVNNSPLQDKLSVLNKLNLQGNFKLDLGLKIDLVAENTSVQVSGILGFEDSEAKVIISGESYMVDNLSGSVRFTQDEIVTDDDITGEFLERPLNIALVSSKELNQAKINVEVDNKLVERLWPVTKNLLYGETSAQINVNFPKTSNSSNPELLIASNLKGMDILLPKPFSKNKHKVSDMKLTWSYLDGNDLFGFSFDDLLQAKIKAVQGKIKNGHIVINQQDNLQADWINEDKILLQGNLTELSVDDIIAWRNMQKNILSDNISVDISILIKTFLFNETPFDKLWLKYQDKEPWIYLDGVKLAGKIPLDFYSDNKLTLNLDKLEFDDSLGNFSNKLIDIDDKPKHWVYFNCKDFIWQHNSLGEVGFHLIPREYGYDIQNFKIDSSNFYLQAEGKWQIKEKISHLTGYFQAHDIGKTFVQFNLGNNLQKTQGQVKFNISWYDDLYNFSLEKVKGAIDFDLHNGFIKGVNPGFGRMISLLNLETIQRRLKLNFSDLSEEGFAFDSLQGDVSLDHGKVDIGVVSIDGPAAKVDLLGGANLIDKSLNFDLNVVPKVSASIPAAAALAAGNPAFGAVGMIIWLFDKATGENINNMQKYKYTVKGSFESPEITLLDSENIDK